MRISVRWAAAAVATLAVMTGCGAQSQVADPVAPEYGWELSYDEALAQLDEAGLTYAAYPADSESGFASIEVEGGALFGQSADAVYLSFMQGGQVLQAVTATFTADAGDLLSAMTETMGQPVSSYQPAEVESSMGGGDFGVYLSPEQVVEGSQWIWRTAEPIAETWSEEELDAYITGYQQAHPDMSFADKAAETIEFSSGARTVWHGSEAFDQYFANNWDTVFSLSGDSGTAMVMGSRFLSPF